MTVLAWVVSAALILFTIRRYLYWVASYFPPRACTPCRTRPIAVLIAARNEEVLLPRLLAALDACDYPSRLLSFVLVSDGSTDATPRLIKDWCARHESALAIYISQSVGKAGALGTALEAAPPSQLVAVMDADTEPAPDALAWLAGAFDNPSVAAACGYPEPRNAETSTTSRYAALERWVYHLIFLAGKDRLGLNPPAIGALSAFRRDALEAIGGFPAGAIAEDVCVAMELVRRGWRTRWVRRAVTREDVATDLRSFREQRSRWNRGLLASRRSASGIEDLLVAAGYVDRLVLIAGIALAVAGWIPWWLPAAFLVAPAVTVITALHRAGVKRRLPYLAAMAFMVLADVTITAASGMAYLVRTPVRWAERPTVSSQGSEAE